MSGNTEKDKIQLRGLVVGASCDGGEWGNHTICEIRFATTPARALAAMIRADQRVGNTAMSYQRRYVEWIMSHERQRELVAAAPELRWQVRDLHFVTRPVCN